MVDYLLVTFIQAEYEAVLNRFQEVDGDVTAGVPGTTQLRTITTTDNQNYTVAISRTSRTGNLEAQRAVSKLIDEHRPRLVLTVGIAGAPPCSDVFLGDVVLGNVVHDLTRSAETGSGREEEADSSYIPQEVRDFVARLARADFIEWENEMKSIDRPNLKGIKKSESKDQEWIRKVDAVLMENKNRSLPKVLGGAIASSDQLIREPGIMRSRLGVNRDIVANDMESAGVAKACEDNHVPLLIVRGISDIVGIERTALWNSYACETSASCAREIVDMGAVNTIENSLNGRQTRIWQNARNSLSSLKEILAEIRDSTPSESAPKCTIAFELFESLPIELKNPLAPELFDTLDRPMKFLGDKSLVLKVAKACIECCRVMELDDKTAECLARALICGTSWVYQRTGELDLAEKDAKESVVISQGIGSTKNLAFCKKCVGRLMRMQAEEHLNADITKGRFKESIEFLNDAISLFSNLDSYGPDHPEIGDCYSLLGRTYLSMGNVERAFDCVNEAVPRINYGSKDYLDLLILQGEIWSSLGQHDKALDAYEEVISETSVNDYQISEIVARAHLQKARTLLHMDCRTDALDAYEESRRIWEHFGERNFAAIAEWEGILAAEWLEKRAIRILEKEAPIVRCEAVRLLKEMQSKKKPSVLAQRRGTDDTVLKNLLRKAKRSLALSSIVAR